MTLITPTLRSDRVVLRPFTPDDTDAVFVLLSNPHVLRYWNEPPWTDYAQAERFTAMGNQIDEEDVRVQLAIERIADGAFIGWCFLEDWDPHHRRATVGLCLDEKVWGQGFATEILPTLVQWAFDTLNLNRIETDIDPRNTAIARVLEKLGFVREGLLREDCIVNDEVCDSLVYGLLRREWKPLQSRSSEV